MVEEHARHRHLGLDLGELETRVLELGQRFAERLAVTRIFDGPRQRRFHDGNGTDGDQQALTRMLVGGTRTSSKNSSAVSCAFCPIFFKLRPRRKPGRSVSTSTRLTPLAPAEVSVLAATMTSWA